MSEPTIDELYRIVWEQCPETLTHADNLASEWILQLGFSLKLAGWNWRDWDHVAKLLACAEKKGILRREGHSFARWRHPDEVLNES